MEDHFECFKQGDIRCDLHFNKTTSGVHGEQMLGRKREKQKN